MKKVLHITDGQGSLQTRACVRMLREGLGRDFTAEHLAIGRGVWWVGHVAKLRGAAKSADVLHAWGLRSLRAATFAGSWPVIYTPLPEDNMEKAAQWVRAALGRREIRVVSLSGADDRRVVTLGIEAGRCMVVRPGVKMGRATKKDKALRETLGFGKDDVVVLAAGDSERYANHRLAVQAISILHFMDRKYKVLVSGNGSEAGAVSRLHASWKVEALTLATEKLGREVNFEELIPAANLALVTAADVLEPYPVLACMAGGLPVVAPATPEVSEILEDRHTALLYSPVKPRMMAQRVLAMAEDGEMAKKVVDQARAEAYELFSVSRFVEEMRKAYA